MSMIDRLSKSFEGDFGGALEIAALLIGAYLLNGAVKILLSYVDSKCLHKDSVLKHALKASLLLPLQTLIWIYALIKALDLISLRLFGSAFFLGSAALVKMATTIAVGWFLLRLKQNIFKHRHENNGWAKGLDHTTKDILDKLLSIFIYVLVIFTLLEQTGTSMNTLIAFGGVSGLAIAFASQQLIANFFGGLMIYLTQPFRIGEQICLPEKGVEGDVEEIGWYATCVRAFDKRPLYIPNSMLNQVMIINNSRMSHRQFKHTLSLRYEDIDKIPRFTKELKNLLENHHAIDSALPPQVYFSEFGPVGLEVYAAAYLTTTDKYIFQKMTEELLLLVNNLATTHNLQLAIPTTSLQIPEGIKIIS